MYPHYVAKTAGKGWKKAEVDEIIQWLTGYSESELEAEWERRTDLETFFARAPQPNAARALIRVVVCGVRVEEAEEPTMREIRYTDELLDELAGGESDGQDPPVVRLKGVGSATEATDTVDAGSGLCAHVHTRTMPNAPSRANPGGDAFRRATRSAGRAIGEGLLHRGVDPARAGRRRVVGRRTGNAVRRSRAPGASRVRAVAAVWALTAGTVGCDPRSGSSSAWTGQVDTLSSGTVVVRNEGGGLWTDDSRWSLVEDLRIGSLDGQGPESFGSIGGLAVDSLRRLWVLDDQANEIRLFDASGAYVRTLGHEGQGPGEFVRPVRVDVAPGGDVWVMDPSNGRLSVFDSTGSYGEGYPAAAGFIMLPWHGGFDRAGHYHTVQPRAGLVAFDESFSPIDTVAFPTDPGPRDAFRIVVDGVTRVAAGVPFQGGMVARWSKAGSMWALFTDEYRLVELAASGDTLRSITMTYSPLPVSSQERADALDDLDWFTRQGGRIDPSLVPDYKPAADWFFVDDEGDAWVARTREEGAPLRFDVFNPTGQFMGTLTAPFELLSSPIPFAADGALYGVVTDELGVEYAVRALIRKP